MNNRKLFSCQKCDANIEVDEPRAQDQVVCLQCGRLYSLLFHEEDNAWHLRAQEPVEEEVEERRSSEQPFAVLAEEGRPKRVDRSEQHREQTDVHDDETVAVDKKHRES